MAVGDHVRLNRVFSPLHATEKDAEDHEIMAFAKGLRPIDWEGVEKSHRAVILAGAGIGKTHEMKRRAKLRREAGDAAFFIRIEDIDEDFEHSFEIGDQEAFNVWLTSSEEAWFYLDSIDEARLDDPRDFERAIRRFAHRIRIAQHRAHILISSRPYAWRSYSDYAMVQKYLPFARLESEVLETVETTQANDEVLAYAEESSEADGSLRVYILNDLTEADIHV